MMQIFYSNLTMKTMKWDMSRPVLNAERSDENKTRHFFAQFAVFCLWIIQEFKLNKLDGNSAINYIILIFRLLFLGDIH